jgi:hypothetical protein
MIARSFIDFLLKAIPSCQDQKDWASAVVRGGRGCRPDDRMALLQSPGSSKRDICPDGAPSHPVLLPMKNHLLFPQVQC